MEGRGEGREEDGARRQRSGYPSRCREEGRREVVWFGEHGKDEHRVRREFNEGNFWKTKHRM